MLMRSLGPGIAIYGRSTCAAAFANGKRRIRRATSPNSREFRGLARMREVQWLPSGRRWPARLTSSRPAAADVGSGASQKRAWRIDRLSAAVAFWAGLFRAGAWEYWSHLPLACSAVLFANPCVYFASRRIALACSCYSSSSKAAGESRWRTRPILTSPNCLATPRMALPLALRASLGQLWNLSGRSGSAYRWSPSWFYFPASGTVKSKPTTSEVICTTPGSSN